MNEGLSFTTLQIWPMVIGGVFALIGMLVSMQLKAKFKKYAATPMSSGLSGKEIAEKMLSDHDIRDVKIICTPGKLSDHYNPRDKTVNLSKEVYEGRNAASTAVAAHEVGHAVQHARAYGMLQVRSMLVPIQNVSGQIMNAVIMLAFFGGYALYSVFPVDAVIWTIVITQGVLALFTLVTLPVEFDASKRALAWIDRKGIVTREEYSMSKTALNWAAATYVVAALAAVASLLYWVMVLMNRD